MTPSARSALIYTPARWKQTNDRDVRVLQADIVLVLQPKGFKVVKDECEWGAVPRSVSPTEAYVLLGRAHDKATA